MVLFLVVVTISATVTVIIYRATTYYRKGLVFRAFNTLSLILSTLPGKVVV